MFIKVRNKVNIADCAWDCDNQAITVTREDMDRFCLSLQRRQKSFIDCNRRMMKAGKIDFNEYEEI